MLIKIKGWSNIDACQHPICERDESVPVYVLWEGNEIEAWYRNPIMDTCWFENNAEVILDGVTMWKER